MKENLPSNIALSKSEQGGDTNGHEKQCSVTSLELVTIEEEGDALGKNLGVEALSGFGGVQFQV